MAVALVSERSVAREATAAWPLVFETGAASVLGFFHPPGERLPRDTAVVLCNPIGWEAVAAHRAQRHLAERLATAGFPVLRFDYPGTGDSSGTDADPERVQAWLSGVTAAIRKIHELAQRPKLALVGFHLGATLAVLAARAAGGVESLVLWSPYAKGRAFTREVTAYRALNAGSPDFPRAEDAGGIESAGFLISAATMAELSALDLTADPGQAAASVLFLERQEKPTPKALIDWFESSGAAVERISVPGYLDMMQEPRKSVVPDAAFEVIARYLDEKHSVIETAPPNPSPASCARLELPSEGSASISEEAITFGPNGEFFGILSEPSRADARRTDLPIVLFLTTAAHHRIGPNRMYVPMARTLAGMGFTCLRFDLTGVGDTPTLPGIVEGHSYAASFVNDVRAAMDHLERVSGTRRFVTVGLCSGAYLGFHTCLVDPRVVGAVLINSQTFNWREGDSLEINRRVTFQSTRFYKQAARNAQVWKRVLRGQVNVRGIANALLERWKKRAEVEYRRIARRFKMKDQSGRVDVGDALTSLIDRATDILVVYSGGDEGLDYLGSEVGSRLRKLQKMRDHFKLEVIDGPDHTFTQLWAQERLAQVVVSHIEHRFAKP